MTPSQPFLPLLRGAFVLGPALLTAGAACFVLGIGLVPPGTSSWVEGILAGYGIVAFVPVYLELSRRLAPESPRLARLTAVTGLFGATAGFGLELARVLEHALRERGAGPEVWTAFYADPGGPFLALALLGPLFPLTSLLLGVGFLRSGTLPRWVAAALVAAGIGFPLAQVGGFAWALKTTYPAACLCWLSALSWIARHADTPARQPAAPQDLVTFSSRNT